MINRDLDKIEIPDNIDEFIDKGINKLKREKEKKVKKHYLKVCSMIAILSIFIIGAFFNSNLASASEGNAFESIFKYFETKLLSNSKISDIETNVNQTINSNNINITIESVACDDNYISISYKVLNKDTFNIKESEIITIGDNVNDEQMLKNAGLGVAMGNSAPYIQKMAKEVTLDNKSGGVAHIVEKYILN